MKRLLVVLAVLLTLAPAASAHGDTGVLELVESDAVSADEVRYVVRLTYANDGEPVSSADVLVSVSGSTPAAMTSDGDGRYSATVSFPTSGEHPVTFSATEPAATLVYGQVVSTTTTVSSTTTTEAPHVADEPLPDPADAKGSGAWLLVLMTIILAVMVTLAIAFVRGRRPPA